MLKNRTIPYNATLLEAFKKMDVLDKKLLIVLDENKFYGLLSAGDIQRAIIQNKPLETQVADVSIIAAGSQVLKNIVNPGIYIGNQFRKFL